jgi:hypothetical protein
LFADLLKAFGVNADVEIDCPANIVVNIKCLADEQCEE